MKNMKKNLVIILLAFLPVMIYAQMAGGQIKRPVKPKMMPVRPTNPVRRKPFVSNSVKKQNVEQSVELVTASDVTISSSKEGIIEFVLYGTKLKVRFDASQRVSVKEGTSEEISRCMNWLVASLEETSEDCLRIKRELNLSDWAFVKMLDKFSVACLGSTNEAVLLMSCLMVDAGYGVNIAKCDNGKLRLLYYSDAIVYNSVYVTLAGKNYYLYGTPIEKKAMLRIHGEYLEGKPINFRYQGQPLLSQNLTKPRILKSGIISDFTFTIQLNKNLIDYYYDIPSVGDKDDATTYWNTLAGYPLEKQLQESLIDKMKQKVKEIGKSQEDAAQLILWWVQTAFESIPDVEVPMPNRFFFAEETLFYSHVEAKDRVILFSRLIRDVLGLDVVLVLYPDHLATAVRFTDSDVKGASVIVNDQRFVICDPTDCYLVGQEKSDVKDKKKTVKLLER